MWTGRQIEKLGSPYILKLTQRSKLMNYKLPSYLASIRSHDQ
jgi:hypothetical protein